MKNQKQRQRPEISGNKVILIAILCTVITVIAMILFSKSADAQTRIDNPVGTDPLYLKSINQSTSTNYMVWEQGAVKINSSPIPVYTDQQTYTYIFAGDIKQDERCLIANGHADEQCRDCNWLETKAYIPDTCILERIYWICEDWQQVEPPNFYLINNGIPILFGITGTSGTITSYPFIFTIYPGTLQWKFVEGTKPNKAIFWVELWL